MSGQITHAFSSIQRSSLVLRQNLMIRYSPLENGYEMGSGQDSVNNITVNDGCYLDGIRDVSMAVSSSKTSKICGIDVVVDSANIEEWKS
ncbi:unnamed protein product [Caenorhabditis brenneri]